MEKKQDVQQDIFNEYEGYSDVTLKLPHLFTDEEKIEIADRLAQIPVEMDKLADQKDVEKKAVKTTQGKIDKLESENLALAIKYERGEEERNIDCKVMYDTPEAGKKTVIRLDTKEKLEMEMTDEDYSLFKGGEAAPDLAKEVKEKDKEITDPEAFAQEIYGKYQINLSEFNVLEEKDVRIINLVGDLKEIGADPDDFEKVQGCLAIRTAEETAVQLAIDKIDTYKGSYPADDEKTWYFFAPVKPEEETE